ncbi:PREDICTED: uncharacterized protein LOC109191804 [Ipomoea nil]|uniref:uncharacterized protein LOC109191804 n=1 Tax=Ipomoea nil TaxID=35883 RepID=UPI000901896B|nr:PREDICTED: uncharacterized protein LOC109191804 [Ipomoea nil]
MLYGAMGAIFHAQSENWIPQSQSHDVKWQSQNLCCSPNFSGSRRRKRSPAGMNPPNSRNHSRANLRPEGASALGPGSPAKNLVMGQVKILKRGEQLPSPSSDTTTTTSSRESSPGSGGVYWNAEEMLVLCSTQRLGPEPETVHKEIKLPDLSAFLVSPLPSSLPIPKFFGTKVKKTGAATCHLR